MDDECVQFRCYNLLKSDFNALKSIVERIPGKSLDSLLPLPETKEYVAWKNFAEEFNLPFYAETSKKLVYNIREGMAILAGEMEKNPEEKDVAGFMHKRNLSFDNETPVAANNKYLRKAHNFLGNCSGMPSFEFIGKKEFMPCFSGEFNNSSKYLGGHKIYFDAENKRIKTLYLKKCNLTSIPEEISLLGCLENLVLYGNRIREVDNVSGLKNLEHLCISNNEICVLRGLPEKLENKLSLAEVYRFEFIDFDNNIKILSDDYFNLEESQLNAFRKMIFKLHLLNDLKDISGKKLDIKIRDNNLVDLIVNCPIFELPDELAEFNKLENLDLSYCKITNVSKLTGLNSLKSLNLTYTLVNDVGSLSLLESLEELHLCNIISEEKFKEIAKKRVFEYNEICGKNGDDPLFFKTGEHVPYRELSMLDPRITDNPLDYFTKIAGMGKLIFLKKIFADEGLIKANEESIELLKESGVGIVSLKIPEHEVMRGCTIGMPSGMH